MRARPARPKNGNRLLADLPGEDRDRLIRQAELRELTLHQSLVLPGKRIDYVHFPEAGIVSLVQPLQDGTAVEIAMVGREGFVGIAPVLGASTSLAEAIVRIPGPAWRIRAAVLRQEMMRSPALLDLLLRYILAAHLQVSQSVACNSRHALPQRVARWLLAARDRVGGDELALSHEALAEMLGMRRASVTVALGALRKAGLIENSPGRIAILDAKGLEAAACECYRTVSEEYTRLLP
jgi:CRP-like cAMP-binding protein